MEIAFVSRDFFFAIFKSLSKKLAGNFITAERELFMQLQNCMQIESLAEHDF